MSRTIYFGTLHEPGLSHEIAFDAFAVGKNRHEAAPNVESADAVYYAEDGSILGIDQIDAHLPVTQLRSNFSQRGFVMIRVRYRLLPPFNVYGFLVCGASDQGTTYPLSAAVGWPENVVWLNRGIFPTGDPPPGWRHEVFIANPSRWAEMRIRFIVHANGARHTETHTLAPRQSMWLNVEEIALKKWGLGRTDAVGIVARNKPSVYVLGRDIATNALSFIEHIVTYPRTNFHIAPPRPHDQPAERSGEALSGRVFCYCNGMTLTQALGAEQDGKVGNYCTGCRDDLRYVRRQIQDGLFDEASLASSLDSQGGF